MASGMEGSIPEKRVRLAEFLRRLAAAAPASTAEEAYRQVHDILNAVEDEMTGIPFDPANWMNDGRMYPPQSDSIRSVKGRPDLKRYASRGHQTIIGTNGAIEIRSLDRTVIFQKPGSDGVSIEGVES
jgi:hypothetical protein